MPPLEILVKNSEKTEANICVYRSNFSLKYSSINSSRLPISAAIVCTKFWRFIGLIYMRKLVRLENWWLI